MEQTVHHIIERFEKAKSGRSNYEGTWDEISKYTAATAPLFSGVREKGGVSQNIGVYDNTPEKVIDMLSAHFQSGLINTGTQWLETRIPGMMSIYEVKTYLKEVDKVLLNTFNSHATRFSTNMEEMIKDYIRYGTGCLYVDVIQGKFVFKAYHLSDIYLQDDFRGKVDTVFRKFKLSTRQVAQEFGEENLHANMRKELKSNKYDDEQTLIHAVVPRADAIKGSKNPKNLPFASYYIDVRNKHVLKESGYTEIPYIVGRFTKTSNEVYGYSPTWTSLSTIKRINVLIKQITIGAQLQNNPPKLVNDESTILPQTTVPGAYIYTEFTDSGRPMIQPMITGADFNVAFQLVQQGIQDIKEAFFVDQLVLPELDRATTSEVNTRNTDRLKLLTPQLIRFQAEVLQPLIERVFGLLLRNNALPEAPEIVEGKELDIEYLGPLAKLLKAGINDSIVRYVSTVGSMLQIDPSILDGVNLQRGSEILADNFGVPLEMLRTPEEMAAIRQQAAQEQEMQQMMQQGLQLTEGVKNLGQAGILTQDSGEDL